MNAVMMLYCCFGSHRHTDIEVLQLKTEYSIHCLGNIVIWKFECLGNGEAVRNC